jgi:outer membrane protein assembly factor BamB
MARRPKHISIVAVALLTAGCSHGSPKESSTVVNGKMTAELVFVNPPQSNQIATMRSATIKRIGEPLSEMVTAPLAPVAKGVIICGAESGIVLCLDARGQSAWKTQLRGGVEFRPVQVGEGFAIVSSDSSGRSFLSLLSSDNGDLLWSKPIGTKANCFPLGSVGPNTVVVYDGTSVVAFSDKGHMKWKKDCAVNYGSELASTPDSKMIIALNDGLVCINEHGHELWRNQIARPSSPVVYSTDVITHSARGELVVLSAKTGESKLVTKITAEVLGAGTHVLLINRDGIAIIRTQGEIGAFSVTEKSKLWLRSLVTDGPARLLMDRLGTVITFAGEKVIAVHTSNGEELWSLELPRPSWSTPAIVGDKLLQLVDTGGWLYQISGRESVGDKHIR